MNFRVSHTFKKKAFYGDFVTAERGNISSTVCRLHTFKIWLLSKINWIFFRYKFVWFIFHFIDSNGSIVIAMSRLSFRLNFLSDVWNRFSKPLWGLVRSFHYRIFIFKGFWHSGKDALCRQSYTSQVIQKLKWILYFWRFLADWIVRAIKLWFF